MKKAVLTAILTLSAAALAAPTPVKVVNPDGSSKASVYTAPAKAKKAWKIGVVFPTLQDPYWLAANYGVMQEARRLGVSVKLVSAKSYADITGQIALIENLAAEGVDAIILAPISSQAQNAKIEEIIQTKKIPVIGLINPVTTPLVAAKRQVSYYDTAFKAGEFVSRDAKGKNVTVAFIPGPAGSGWAEDMLKGFQAATKSAPNVKIGATKWGDTTKDVQYGLVQNVMQALPKVDYLVVNAVAGEAAVNILASTGKAGQTKIVTTYANPAVADAVSAGTIAMVPTDYTVNLARLAVDAAVEVLEGKKVTPTMGTVIGEITATTAKKMDYTASFSPKNYKPEFFVNWK